MAYLERKGSVVIVFPCEIWGYQYAQKKQDLLRFFSSINCWNGKDVGFLIYLVLNLY